jgi:hypothetical protein
MALLGEAESGGAGETAETADEAETAEAVELTAGRVAPSAA